MNRRFPVAIGIVAFLAASCSEALVEPVEDDPVGLKFDFMQGPANAGNSDVARLQEILWTWTGDGESDLRPYLWEANDPVTCPGGTKDELLWDIQTNGKGNIIAHLRSSPVVIYQQSALTAVCPDDPTYTTPSATCCAFLADDWLYKGTVDAVSTISLWYGSGPGSFVLSLTGHGNVYDPYGNWYRYTDRQKARLDPKGNWIGWTHERVRVF